MQLYGSTLWDIGTDGITALAEILLIGNASWETLWIPIE